MNKIDRKHRDTLYDRLTWLEGKATVHALKEAAALRWAIRLLEEADLLGVLPQLKASRAFPRSAWLERQQEVERRERARRDRKAALIELNRQPRRADAMEHRLPGSFESGKRR